MRSTSRVAAVVFLLAGSLGIPSADAAASTSTVGFDHSGVIQFRSIGERNNNLRATFGSVDSDPNDPALVIEHFIFTDDFPISSTGSACRHPDPANTRTVTCTVYFTASADPATDSQVRFHLGAGDDRLIVDHRVGFGDRIYGEAGDDRLVATSSVYVLDGGPGNDSLTGPVGNDLGRAIVSGGDGSDSIGLLGATGRVAVTGGRGNDRIYAGQGNDTVYGNSGNDLILGRRGNDYISGGPGNDTIYGNSGNDEIHGGPGRDLISGGPGVNRIFP